MIYEQRTLGNERVDTVRITLDTPPDLIAQYARDGFNEVFEHYIVLYKKKIPQAEAERLKVVVDDLAKIDLTTALKADLVAAIGKVREAIRPIEPIKPIEVKK